MLPATRNAKDVWWMVRSIKPNGIEFMVQGAFIPECDLTSIYL